MLQLWPKLLPLFGCWLLLSSAHLLWRDGRGPFALAAGFAAGIISAKPLEKLLGTPLLIGVRWVLGLLVLAIIAKAVIKISFPTFPAARPDYFVPKGTISFISCWFAGVICVLSLPSFVPIPIYIVLVVGGGLLTVLSSVVMKMLHRQIVVIGLGLLSFTTAVFLLVAAHSARLDLFAPFTMKVMKLLHDMTHQTFETLLLPDHLFLSERAWWAVGLLFSKSIGVWGGLLLWLIVPLLAAATLYREPLPTVDHIRQGAIRRQQLAAFLKNRRRKLILPLMALVVMALASVRALFPSIDYWNPRPIAISSKPNGEVFVPLRTDAYDLSDGQMQKFIVREGRSAVRFLVVMKADGSYTATLDACAICQPEGYGQGEDSLICYYCNTLIPMATVGIAGGCNPVPVPFRMDKNGLALPTGALLQNWEAAVQEVKSLPAPGAR